MSADSTVVGLQQGAFLLASERLHVAARQRWMTGIKSIDVELKDALSGGRVIGLAEDAEDQSSSLASHIIATFLNSQTSSSPSESATSVFVICPPSSQTATSVATLLASVSTSAESLLARMQLQQYLSIPGLTSILSDVSSAIYSRDQQPQPAVLLLQGLSATLADLSRRSGQTHAAAIAANILRELTHLSRTYVDLLVLLELDLHVHDPAHRSSGRGRLSAHAASSIDVADTDLSTAFASSTGQSLFLSPIMTPVIGSVILAGLDSLLAVHTGFGRTIEHDRREAKKSGPHRGTTMVVELLQDRLGGDTGKWAMWVRS